MALNIKKEENPRSLGLILRTLSFIQYCIITVCIACLIIQWVKCFNKYLAKDSKVHQSVLPVQNVTFIAFTVCPSYHDSYKVPMLKKYGTSKDNYKKGKGASILCGLSMREHDNCRKLRLEPKAVLRHIYQIRGISSLTLGLEIQLILPLERKPAGNLRVYSGLQRISSCLIQAPPLPHHSRITGKYIFRHF